MNWLKQLSARHRRHDDLSPAIREHLDEKIADFMERGMTRDEADKAARREFGNATLIEQRSRKYGNVARRLELQTSCVQIVP